LLAIAGACVSGANLENDEGSSSDTRADAGTPKRDAGKGSTDDDDEPTDDDGTDEEGDDVEDEPDAKVSQGDGGRSDAGKDAGPVVDVISGSAKTAGCSSISAAEDGMCSSHFCGVTEEQLSAVASPDSVCGDVVTACEQGGKLAKAVTDCSIQVKASNLGKTNEQLRPLVSTCVYKDAELKEKVGTECLGCFLTVAECAGDKCLVQCLTGTQAACDKCRIDKGCEQPLFECVGLPSPL
jgi:hypothetical protein